MRSDVPTESTDMFLMSDYLCVNVIITLFEQVTLLHALNIFLILFIYFSKQTFLLGYKGELKLPPCKGRLAATLHLGGCKFEPKLGVEITFKKSLKLNKLLLCLNY